MNAALSAERLRSVLHYDPDTGLFRRIIPAGGVKTGQIVASLTTHGYYRIGVDGHRYKAHRLAWFYIHGRWPANQIDHINGVKTDNRLANLREASASQNHANMPKAGKSPFKGVRYDGSGWEVQIQFRKTSHYVGRFSDPISAARAYDAAAVSLHGAFAKTNASLGLLQC